MGWLHQVILNILVIKNLANKVFDHIDPWGETIAYISWSIRVYYHCTIRATPNQYEFVRDVIFNVESVID